MFDNVSMLTVAELAADPDLQLELVAGHRGADREIEAAAVSELANPGPWLQGGELLLTIGLLLPDTVEGCREYLPASTPPACGPSRWGWAPYCRINVRPRG